MADVIFRCRGRLTLNIVVGPKEHAEDAGEDEYRFWIEQLHTSPPSLAAFLNSLSVTVVSLNDERCGIDLRNGSNLKFPRVFNDLEARNWCWPRDVYEVTAAFHFDYLLREQVVEDGESVNLSPLLDAVRFVLQATLPAVDFVEGLVVTDSILCRQLEVNELTALNKADKPTEDAKRAGCTGPLFFRR